MESYGGPTDTVQTKLDLNKKEKKVRFANEDEESSVSEMGED